MILDNFELHTPVENASIASAEQESQSNVLVPETKRENNDNTIMHIGFTALFAAGLVVFALKPGKSGR